MLARFGAFIAPFVCPACADGAGTMSVGNDQHRVCPVCHGSGMERPLMEHADDRASSFFMRRLHLR